MQSYKWDGEVRETDKLKKEALDLLKLIPLVLSSIVGWEFGKIIIGFLGRYLS